MKTSVRNLIRNFAFVSIATLVMGCTSKDEKPAPVKEAIGVVESVKDWTFEKKTEFVDFMKKGMSDVGKEIDELMAKVEDSTHESKAESKARLEAVREKLARAKRELDRATGSDQSTWDKIKSTVKEANSDVKVEFDKARQWLKDKL